MKHICPVCFYAKLPYPPRDYHICPCCGTEFGNDDAEFSHDQLREMSIAGGANWFFGRPPAHWNPWMELFKYGGCDVYAKSWHRRKSEGQRDRKAGNYRFAWAGNPDQGGSLTIRSSRTLACEKVIIDQDGTATLVSLFNRLTIEVPFDAEIPKNAVAPKQWAVYFAWDADPGDENQANFLCTPVFYPDQSPFGETARIPMPVEVGKRSQINAQCHGFPIGQTGPYLISTWVEQNEKRVSPTTGFKIDLEIKRQPKPT